MNTSLTDANSAIDYPDCDGNPMSDNTLQFRWIVTLQGGLDSMFRHDPNVFVAGDLLWYPVEGDNKTRLAPDVMVVFRRPKGYRGSYMQWREEGVAPQVVFEVLSPNNHAPEMAGKLAFYDKHDVQEYYVYDPDHITLEGYVRGASGRLLPIREMNGYRSPLLRITFDLNGDELRVLDPQGNRFLSYVELMESRMAEFQRAEEANQREEESRRREEQERRKAEKASEEAERLRAKLRAAGIDPDS